MGLPQNAKPRIVVVLAPLFLGFVMPWMLQVNREARNLSQYKYDPNAMLVSIILEVVLVVVFAAVFALSLLYLAKQDNARKRLMAASIISLVAFAFFAMGRSLSVQASFDGWLYYVLMQLLLQIFPGLILVVGYATAAIAVPPLRPFHSNKP